MVYCSSGLVETTLDLQVDLQSKALLFRGLWALHITESPLSDGFEASEPFACFFASYTCCRVTSITWPKCGPSPSRDLKCGPLVWQLACNGFGGLRRIDANELEHGCRMLVMLVVFGCSLAGVAGRSCSNWDTAGFGCFQSSVRVALQG